MKAEWEVRFRGFVVDRDESGDRVPAPDELEPFMDAVGYEFENLNAKDILIETNLAKGRVDLSLTVEAFQFEEAVVVASGLIRAAFHTAGAATPDWSVDWLEVKAYRPADLEGEPPRRSRKKELVDA